MRFHVLATDYDGTLAHDGVVDEATLAALGRVKESGRYLALVTGRILEELLEVFPQVTLFDCVVAENGALVYRPQTGEEFLLAKPPPHRFFEALRAAGAAPLQAGRIIVATREPHEHLVLSTIRDLGLELQVIFNKGAVMVLPTGINKASGLSAALEQLGLSAHNAVGVGDAENDHAFLEVCECSVAVANALPLTKQYVNWVTQGARGAGVIELIEQLIDDDLRGIELSASRSVLLGTAEDKTEVRLPAYAASALLSGSEGAGKTTFASGFVERGIQQGYQFCIVDPEGDYDGFDGTLCVGDARRAPSVEEVGSLLEKPGANIVINLLAVSLQERPGFCAQLLSRLSEMRRQYGRPHWLVIDEAHHFFPADDETAPPSTPIKLESALLITLHPDHLAVPVVKTMDAIIAIGKNPSRTIGGFGQAVGCAPSELPPSDLGRGEAVIWWAGEGMAPVRFASQPPRARLRRHTRKYAEGELAPEVSFYFKGPQGKLNLRAQNLLIFLQLADGVDDETWNHHLRRHDYSRWFREALRDDDLAREAEEIENAPDATPQSTRAKIRERIEKRYTAPE